MKYEQLEDSIKKLLAQNDIIWDSSKSVYMTKLHKNFYLNDREVNQEDDLVEFCELIQFLKSNPEYGVSTEWALSNLNKYVYLNNKSSLKDKFPRTIEALARFYDDSDIINFYKSQGAKAPTIIDLVGTTGAGKTTFCQQFVDDDSKDLLKLTITDSAESTVIQTDILILEKTKKKMFLKVRNRSEIMRDILAVALEVEINDINSSLKDAVKKSGDSIDNDILDKVNNFFSTESLLNAFKVFASEVQEKYKEEFGDKFKWIQQHANDDQFVYILEDNIREIFNTIYFYGYRIEYDLEVEAENKIITTIANTIFKDRKEELEDYPEMRDVISYRLLFDHAILVFPCSHEAKDKLGYDFQQGLVFRDSQGHKLDEQNGIASDFEVKNKVFLIPVDNGGYLIDDRYSNLFEKILISEPKNNVFVLTKVDNTTTYKHYKKSNYEDSKKFNKEFKEKIAKTHNKLLENFLNKQKKFDNSLELHKDETLIFQNFMASFNKAYLSEIDDITYAAEAHKINYSGSPLEQLDKSKLEIEYCDKSWFEIIGSVIKENKLTYYTNISRIKDVNETQEEKIIIYCTDTIRTLVNFYISTQDWENEVEEQLKVFNEDFRSVYQKGSVWFYSNYITDGNTTINSSYFKDLTAKIVRDINSYIIKDKGDNYIKNLLQVPLANYLGNIYSSKSGNSFEMLNSISNKIIANSLEKSAKIAYKVFDRQLMDRDFLDNIEILFSSNSNKYVQPSNITFDDIKITKRSYGTYTEYYAGIYCNLLAKFKYNLETYFLDIFKTVIDSELKELNEKVK